MEFNHHHIDTSGTPGGGFYLSIFLALLGNLIGSVDWAHAEIPKIVMQGLQCLAWICPAGILWLTYKNQKRK